MIESNVKTGFSSVVSHPRIDPSTYVHPLASVIGNVELGKNIMVSPTACVRGDEGQPIHIGDDSNVQDGVVIHALETESDGRPIDANLFDVGGNQYAVHIGTAVSLAHQVQVHGPAVIGDETFVGMKSLVFKSRIGRGCVIEPCVLLMGVAVPDGRVVPAGAIVRTQEEADRLPAVTDDYPLKNMNRNVVHVNRELAREYLKREASQ